MIVYKNFKFNYFVMSTEETASFIIKIYDNLIKIANAQLKRGHMYYVIECCP